MKVILCFLSVLAVAFAWGKPCPSLDVQDPFLLANFTGTWYKQYGLNTPLEVGTCFQSIYTLNETTQELALDSTYKTIFGGGAELRGTAVQTNTSSTEGKLTVTLVTALGAVTSDVWVLSTDYENYAVLYSCTEIVLSWFDEPYESVWVVTREQALSTDVSLLIEAAMAVISHDGGPSFSELTPSSQKNCS